MGHGDMQPSIRVTYALTLAVTHEYRARRAAPARFSAFAPLRHPSRPAAMPLYIAGDSSVPYWYQYGHEDGERGNWVGPGLRGTHTRSERRRSLMRERSRAMPSRAGGCLRPGMRVERNAKGSGATATPTCPSGRRRVRRSWRKPGPGCRRTGRRGPR